LASRGSTARWLAAAALVTPVQRWLVLVHAVPYEQPWRTGCPHCGAGLRPAAGWGSLLPAAGCHGCRHRIGAPAFLLEAATLVSVALVVVAVAGGRWPWPAAVGLAGFAAVAVPLTFIDLAVHRLPDRLTLPVAGWVLGWLGVAALTGGAGWLRAVAAAAVCGLGFAAVTLIFGSRGFGLGDAKLAISAGALLGWLGWTALVAGLLLAFLLSGLVAAALLATRRVSRRDSLPFGPFLAGGTLAAIAWVGLSG
jgi:leader peptidase (prepilin peptidase)/N-methyltransferase